MQQSGRSQSDGGTQEASPTHEKSTETEDDPVGGEVRWYFRQKSFLHAQPTGSMVGWWTGGRLDVAVDGTQDEMTDRWIGTTVEIGTSALVGYRFAPWRGLEISPSLNGGVRHEFAKRLPGWTRPMGGIGLTVGWLF